MPGFRDQQTLQLSLSFPEHWNTIRMPIAITTDIITMAIADTIAVPITTATGIKVLNKAEFTNSEICSILI